MEQENAVKEIVSISNDGEYNYTLKTKKFRNSKLD